MGVLLAVAGTPGLRAQTDHLPAAPALGSPTVTWSLHGLELGFCIDFLMDSVVATKQIHKTARDYLGLPAREFGRLNPALAGLIERRPEYGAWIPSTICFLAADSLMVGGRVNTDRDPAKRQMAGFWGVAARPPTDPSVDSLLVVRALFTNNHRVSRATETKGLEAATVKESLGMVPEREDQRYETRIERADIRWDGHLAGAAPDSGESRTWTLAVRGRRNDMWTAVVRIWPRHQQTMVGSLLIQGKGDLAAALKGSPIRMQTSAFWSGVGTLEFYR